LGVEFEDAVSGWTVVLLTHEANEDLRAGFADYAKTDGVGIAFLRKARTSGRISQVALLDILSIEQGRFVPGGAAVTIKRATKRKPMRMKPTGILRTLRRHKERARQRKLLF
jgi:hypothetical protein